MLVKHFSNIILKLLAIIRASSKKLSVFTLTKLPLYWDTVEGIQLSLLLSLLDLCYNLVCLFLWSAECFATKMDLMFLHIFSFNPGTIDARIFLCLPEEVNRILCDQFS